jgi:excisionase family DNA binding protein
MTRTSNPPRSPMSKADTTGVRGRPLTRLRTIDEAAELLNVSPRTVRRLIESGALPVHRLGRLVRIGDADLAAFLAASRIV